MDSTPRWVSNKLIPTNLDVVAWCCLVEEGFGGLARYLGVSFLRGPQALVVVLLFPLTATQQRIPPNIGLWDQAVSPLLSYKRISPFISGASLREAVFVVQKWPFPTALSKKTHRSADR